MQINFYFVHGISVSSTDYIIQYRQYLLCYSNFKFLFIVLLFITKITIITITTFNFNCKLNRFLILLLLRAASMGSFCSGLFVGWSSHATYSLSESVCRNQTPHNCRRYQLYIVHESPISLYTRKYIIVIYQVKPVDSSETIARISSALALGAAIGPLVVNKVWYAIGTKSTILFGCLIMSTSVIGLYIKYVYNVECRFSINYKCVQCL